MTLPPGRSVRGCRALVLAVVLLAGVAGCSAAVGGSPAAAARAAAVATGAAATTAEPLSSVPAPAPSATPPVTTPPVATPLPTPSSAATTARTATPAAPPTGSPPASGPVDLTTAATGATARPPGTLAVGPTPVRPDRAGTGEVHITGALPTGVDQVARDSIVDITTYWAGQAPDVFGAALTPLRGGYYSVDPAGSTTAPCLKNAKAVANNAFYCPQADAIVYDRTYLKRIASDYSDLDVALTFAHEFGHALQQRFPSGAQRSIALETQADCYAGAWADWVTRGHAAHFAFDPVSLDRVLGDYVWEMGDPAGTDPDHLSAHGSVFDRVTAMQEGYLDGPHACVTDFSDKRAFVAQKFTADNSSADGQGNVALSVALTQGTALLQDFWTAAGTAAGRTYVPPIVVTDDPACSGDHVVALCPDGRTIDVDPLTAMAAYHDQIGDFATVTTLGLAYADYAQRQFGTDRSVPPRICATGAFAAAMFNESPPVLSPGDLDEAVRLLLVAGPGNRLIDTGAVSAWDRLDAFRTGVFGGLAACHLSG